MTIPAGEEPQEARSSLSGEPPNESVLGRSDDLSDAAMEVGSVTNSEISTLYPHDSISQRGEEVEHPSSSETRGKDSAQDIHSLTSDGMSLRNP